MYYDRETMTIGDVVTLTTPILSELPERTALITRLKAHDDHLGQGGGSRVLAEICADADAEGMTLVLEPSPYFGEQDYDRLVAFYERFGFTHKDAFYMLRPPKENNAQQGSK